MTTTATIDMDLLPALNQLVGVLETETDVVRQQQLIELLTARHCMRALQGYSDADALRAALIVADGVHKHVRQLIGFNREQ
jgi:hypothetical protein